MKIIGLEKDAAGLPVCPCSGVCGGCSYQGVPYEDQLKNKAGEAMRAFSDCGLDPALISSINAAPERYHYRNRMDYTFGNEYKDGPTILGLHRKKSFMSVTDCSRCNIVHPDFNKILLSTLSFCLSKGYSHYNKKTHSGLLRNLILRRGVRTGELLVNIVTCSDPGFDEEGFAKHILSIPLEGRVCGILRTINDNIADAVIPEELRLLYGRDSYEEIVLGLRFTVSAFSFFQTNVAAAERLYSDALSMIPGIEGKTVYDLYCGTGTISQAMALKAGKVIGVEIVEDAVRAAEENAALNKLDNCSFIAGDVLNVLDGIREKPNIIVMDPPRSGVHPKALSKILSYGVPEILYISCNPKTMAENLRAARLSGYSTDEVSLYDNFPFTKHTEALCLLKKTGAADDARADSQTKVAGYADAADKSGEAGEDEHGI
ncbi:MAG: 23S rRNA (uracil(1939)-C(5))-methyltransferase RlmD [Firmicutes bacterium]|nr:23S rRNA (uracil(1939)-C(5))-methyltransferase RlmD [Bacillota bacterium]